MATLIPFKGTAPVIADDAFVAPNAVLIGDIVIGSRSSIWYGCAIRGDVNHIRIGRNSNIQDNSVIHVDSGKFPTIIGDDVLVGHMCIVHGCTLEDGTFVGMNSTIMDGCVMESGSMLAAGSLLTPGKRVPARQLWAGRPAKFMRELSDEDIARFKWGTDHYADLAQAHLVACRDAGV